MSFLQSQPDGSVLLSVHVQPRAAATGLAGLHGEALKIRLNCPPVDGRANKALVDFLADLLDVPKSHLSIIRGKSNRSKLLRIMGADESVLRKRLRESGG